MQGIYPGIAGAPPAHGARERISAYADMPWLHAVADKISSAFAAVDWQLKVVKPAGAPRAVRVKALQTAIGAKRRALFAKAADAGEVQEITEHPLLDLLRDGNPYMTGLAMRKVTQLHLYLEGDAFWVKDRNALGRPAAVWPVPPNWVAWTPTPSRRTFRVSFRGWQGEIPDSEILWFSDHDPANPYARGAGMARALADELETDEYAAKMCHDGQTECLTRRGWVRGLQLTDSDEIATWNDRLGVIEYQRPIGITRAAYDGAMHHWHNQFIDAMVTPTHRMWVHAGHGRGLGRPGVTWHFAESRELVAKPMARLSWRDAGFYDGQQKTVAIPAVKRITKRRRGSRGGDRPPMYGVDDPRTFDAHAFAPFLGYYVSEGNVSRASSSLGQTEGRYVNAIRDSLRVFPIEWVKETRGRTASGKTGYRWFVRHLGVAEWLREHVGEGAANKKLPVAVFAWPVAAQRALLDALVDGDGTRTKTAGTPRTYDSISERLIDDVQRLCVQVGWSSRKVRHGSVWHLAFTPIGGAAGIVRVQRPRWSCATTRYEGTVWCVTVRNERFFTRRNGRVMLGGNTRQTFFNQNRPDFVVYPKAQPGGAPASWSDSERLRLQQDWGAQHEGFWRAFKARFASRELGIYEFKEQSFRGLQMEQIRRLERDIVMQVSGLPPELLGVLEHSNRSTIDAASLIFTRWVLGPRLEAFRAILQERLVPEFDERLILDFTPSVEEDREFMKWIAEAAPWSRRVDEWRRLQDLEELENGEGQVFPIPSTLTFGPLNGAPPAEPPGAPPASAAGLDLNDLKTDELRALRRAALRQLEGGSDAERLAVAIGELAKAAGTKPPPAVHVAAPVVHVAAPVVNVAPATVTVPITVPPPGPTRREYQRDEKGLIIGHVEQIIEAPRTDGAS